MFDAGDPWNWSPPSSSTAVHCGARHSERARAISAARYAAPPRSTPRESRRGSNAPWKSLVARMRTHRPDARWGLAPIGTGAGAIAPPRPQEATATVNVSTATWARRNRLGWRMADVRCGMPYLKATADGGKPLLTAFCELLTLTQRFGESRRQSTSFPPSAISHPPSELQ